MWILVGALVGAVAGAAGAIITAKLRGQEVNWRDVGAAALTGAVTGAIASATFGAGLAASPLTRTVAGAALGAAAGAGGTMLSNAFNGRPVMTGVRNAAIAGAVGGAIAGFALGPVAPELPAPSVTQTVTSGALGNGTAQITDNLLEGRDPLDHVLEATVTGAAVAGGAHAATPLVEGALSTDTVSTVPRPTVEVETSQPPPALPPETNAPPVAPLAEAPPPPEETPAAPGSGDAAPPAARGPPSGIGMAQAIEKLICDASPGGDAPATSGEPEQPAAPAPRTPDDLAMGGAGFGAPRGTSPRVGDFTGIAGESIPEILARIPANAQVRELTPVEGGAQRGYEYKWNDGTSTWRVRIHDADPSSPAGSNAHDGWVVRVQRGKQYMDETGTFYHHNSHNPDSPNYNPDAANATHIPVAGNPHAPAHS